MPDLPLAVLDDAHFDAHRPPAGHAHPERPERLAAARRGLEARLPRERRMAVPARPAREAELARVHTPAYLDSLRRALGQGWGYLDPDTYFGPDTAEAAWLAAGGAIALVDRLLDAEAARAVGLVRPPGHHATPGAAMGFCLLNNVAVAAAHALGRGLGRVAIVDWDVHHGNGTQAAFDADPRVLFISLHEWPLYPGTGRAEDVGQGDAAGTTIHLALPAGSGPAIYGEAFRRVVLPALEAFEAELVLVSAGFDGHAADPLAHMNLDEGSYAAMATALVRHVDQQGHGRLALLLEGGYDLSAIEASVGAVMGALLGERTDLPTGQPRAIELEAVERSIRAQAPYWRL